MTTEVSPINYNGSWNRPVRLLTLRRFQAIENLFDAYHLSYRTLRFDLSRLRGRARTCAGGKVQKKCPVWQLTRGGSS
jgi:hypothetical protein